MYKRQTKFHSHAAFSLSFKMCQIKRNRSLRSTARCAILIIEKGIATEAAYPQQLITLHFYDISRQLLRIVGGYFFPLKIWYNRLIRATTNKQNWNNSEYVTIVSPSFLPSGGLLYPPKIRGLAAFGSVVSHIDII